MDSSDPFVAWLLSQGVPAERLRAALAGRASDDSRALPLILLEQGLLNPKQAEQALAARSVSRPIDPRNLSSGTRIGPYLIERRLGVGGMGAVYLVKSPESESLALKILLERDIQTLARFERERRLLGRLSASEGFVPLRDAGESHYGPYIVTAYVPGGSLRDRLKQRQNLDCDEVEQLARRLAGALAVAHEMGIVHRDLKPDNILFDEDGEALISDLGIGKTIVPGAQEGPLLTASHSSLGTPAYMAPEQLDSSRDVGPSADIWAMGVLLYEALVGARPFQGGSATEELINIGRGRFQPLSSFDISGDAALFAVIESCLELEAEARPRDGRALLEALERPLEESPQPPSAMAWSLALVGLMLLGSLGLVMKLTQEAPAKIEPPRIPESPEKPAEAPTPPAPPQPRWKSPRPRSLLKRAQEQNASGLLQPTWLWGTGEHSDIGMLTSLRRLPEQGLLVTAGLAGVIRVWSEDRGAELLSVVTDLSEGCHDMLIHEQDGVIIASSHSHSIDQPGRLGFWEIETGAPRGQAIEAPKRSRLAWLERPGQGRELVAAGFDGVAIWSWPELELRARWRDEPDSSGEPIIENYVSLFVRPERIILSRHDGRLSLINPDSGELLIEHQNKPGGFERLLDGGDHGIFALARRRALARIDPSSLRTQWEVDGLDKNLAVDHIRAATLLSNGELLTSGDDFLVHRWRIDQGERLASFSSPHRGWMTDMLALDSERAISVGNDGQIQCWRSSDGKGVWPNEERFVPGTLMACRSVAEKQILALAIPGLSPNPSKVWIHETWSGRRIGFEIPGFPTSLCPSPWGSGFLISGFTPSGPGWIIECDAAGQSRESPVASFPGSSSPLRCDPNRPRVAYIVFGQGIFELDGGGSKPKLLRSTKNSNAASEVDLKWENGNLYTYGADFSVRDMDGRLVAPGFIGRERQERLLDVMPCHAGEIGLVVRFNNERKIDRSRVFLRTKADQAPQERLNFLGPLRLVFAHEDLLLIGIGTGHTSLFNLVNNTSESPRSWLLGDEIIAGAAVEKAKGFFASTSRGFIYRLERR